ncbi:MAG: apolipoprotein N-acyltransferase, partial [Elainellaceae cyanobacterium]
MPSRHWIKALLKAPLGLAIIGGLSMGVTVAPVGAWPLAWVALAPLWIVVCSSDKLRSAGARTMRSAAGYGFVWGLLYGGIVVHWLWFLHPLTWMGVPWLASLAIAAFCWGIVAITGGLWIGAWAACFALLSRAAGHQRSTWAVTQRLLLGTALWAGLDMIMRQGILYWPSLALTQSPVNLVALHLSRLSGPTTLSVAIVAVNGLLAEAWLQARWMRLDAKGVPQRESTQFHGLNPSKGLKGSEAVRPKHLIAAALGVLIGVHGLGLLILHLPTPSGVPLTVGIIQGNIPTRIKLFGEGIRRALQGYTQGYETLAAKGAEVVVLPEGALPFRWRQEREPEVRNPLAAAIHDRGVTALVGTFALREGKLTQSLLAVEGDGTIAGRYDKLKLVPLGEYIPLQDTLGKLVGRLSPVQSDMLPGSSRQTFMAGFGQAIA